MVLTRIVMDYVNVRSGNPRFEGSNDLTNWTTISNFDGTKATLGGSVCSSQTVYNHSFVTDGTGYRYIRVYSAGSAYLRYYDAIMYGFIKTVP